MELQTGTPFVQNVDFLGGSNIITWSFSTFIAFFPKPPFYEKVKILSQTGIGAGFLFNQELGTGRPEQVHKPNHNWRTTSSTSWEPIVYNVFILFLKQTFNDNYPLLAYYWISEGLRC